MKFQTLSTDYNRDVGMFVIEGKEKELDKIQKIADKITQDDDGIDQCELSNKYGEVFITLSFLKGHYTAKEVKGIYMEAKKNI